MKKVKKPNTNKPQPLDSRFGHRKEPKQKKAVDVFTYPRPGRGASGEHLN